MFEITLQPNFGAGASEIERLIAQTIGANPAVAAVYAAQSLDFINKAKKGASDSDRSIGSSGNRSVSN